MEINFDWDGWRYFGLGFYLETASEFYLLINLGPASIEVRRYKPETKISGFSL